MVYSYTQPLPNPGHGGDAVLVSINGVEKTLQEALDDGSLAGAGGGSLPSSGLLTCFDAAMCPGSSTTVGPGLLSGSRCCYVEGGAISFLYDAESLEIGFDNNGNSDPDCWVISSKHTTQCGKPYLPPGSGGLNCGFYFPGSSSAVCTHEMCVKEALAWYNTLAINGKKGGWAVKEWRDSGQASPCLDATSDKIDVTFIRNVAAAP